MLRKSLPAMISERFGRAKRKLLAAFVCYLVLAAVAVLMLDGFLRGSVLCLLAILAVKTVVHADEEMPD